MSKKNEKITSSENQPDFENWTQAKVEEAIKRDIKAAFSLLRLVHENPVVLEVVSQQILIQLKELKDLKK